MSPAQESLGFRVGPARTLLAATYVDNNIVFGRDATGVGAVLAWAQGWLRAHWAVDLADSSLVPVGASVAPTRLARAEAFKFLGHWISSNGAGTRCVHSAKSAVRTATYRGLRVLRDAKVPLSVKWRFLESCVFSGPCVSGADVGSETARDRDRRPSGLSRRRSSHGRGRRRNPLYICAAARGLRPAASVRQTSGGVGWRPKPSGCTTSFGSRSVCDGPRRWYNAKMQIGCASEGLRPDPNRRLLAR